MKYLHFVKELKMLGCKYRSLVRSANNTMISLHDLSFIAILRKNHL